MDLHSGCTLRIQTPWGFSNTITTERGAGRGSNGGHFVAKSTQEPRLRLLETHDRPYKFSKTLPVHAFFCIDDGMMNSALPLAGQGPIGIGIGDSHRDCRPLRRSGHHAEGRSNPYNNTRKRELVYPVNGVGRAAHPVALPML